jgi:hypothetical protein
MSVRLGSNGPIRLIRRRIPGGPGVTPGEGTHNECRGMGGTRADNDGVNKDEGVKQVGA